ncbi:PAS domain-containing protein [Kaistia adipata]|uniref:PAS domain-containing protein n=1 Tax=Kaistia adipata TaxID=166954 RepID=UPI0004135841|nr:PAS domain-containing protein [Kaistia adipata]
MDSQLDPSIAALYAYWTRQRGSAPAPLRSAIAPADIVPLLGDVFILDAAQRAAMPFRLAGTRLCASFGRELRDEDFLALWARADIARAAEALLAVTAEAAAIALRVAAINGRGQAVGAEMILLPMSQDGRAIDRVLGLLAPAGHPTWLGLHPIRQLDIVATGRLPSGTLPAPASRAASADRPAPAASPRASERAAVIPEPRPRLVVLEGGRR